MLWQLNPKANKKYLIKYRFNSVNCKGLIRIQQASFLIDCRNCDKTFERNLTQKHDHLHLSCGQFVVVLIQCRESAKESYTKCLSTRNYFEKLPICYYNWLLVNLVYNILDSYPHTNHAFHTWFDVNFPAAKGSMMLGSNTQNKLHLFHVNAMFAIHLRYF